MTEAQLKAALLQAHQKGDKEAAQLFANKIKELRAQQPEQQERGFMGKVSDAFTGADRQTQQTQELKGIGMAPELNELSLSAAKTGLVQTFGSEQSFVNRLKDIGANLTQDEKGNMIAELPSGSYLVNHPGVDLGDVAKFGSQAGLFAAGSAVAAPKIAAQALAGGLTSAGMQGVADAAGGGEGINLEQTLTDAALGGAGQALSNVASGIGKMFRPLDETAEAVQATRFAQANDLPMMTSDVAQPSTFAGRAAQSIGEKVPLVGTAEAREAQQVARQNIVREVAERFGSPSTDDIMQSLKSSNSTVKRAAGNRIETIKNQMGDQTIPLSKTAQAIDDLLYDMAKPGKAFDESTAAKLNQFKKTITSAPNDLETLRANRTYFREFVKGDNPVLSSQADRANQIVYKAMTDDMADGIKATLGDEAASRLRYADSVYASEVGAVKNTKLKNILAKGDQTPEVVNGLLFSKKPSEVSLLYRNLDQQGRQNARAAVINKAFEQFAKDDSPQRFLTSIRDMKPQIDIMFKGQDKAYMDGLVKYLAATKRAGEAAVLTPTGQQMIAPAAVFDIMTTGGSGSAGAAGVGALARLYESKPVRDIVLKLNNAKPGSQEFEKLSAELTRLITSSAQAETE